MSRPRSNEMVKPRRRSPHAALNCHWKVTARYAVDNGSDTPMQCVRVHAFHQSGITLHFTVSRFNALFEAVEVRRG